MFCFFDLRSACLFLRLIICFWYFAVHCIVCQTSAYFFCIVKWLQCFQFLLWNYNRSHKQDFFYIATICAVTFFRCRIHICAFIFKYASALGFHVLQFLLFFFLLNGVISRCFLFLRFCM